VGGGIGRRIGSLDGREVKVVVLLDEDINSWEKKLN
jgi:hypothetical protein